MSKDVFICVDVSGSMGIAVSNGNNRLEECKLAMFSLLDANILAEVLDKYTFAISDKHTCMISSVLQLFVEAPGHLGTFCSQACRQLGSCMAQHQVPGAFIVQEKPKYLISENKIPPVIARVQGDRFGFKQFDHKVDTLMPIIPVDDKSIGTLREKVSQNLKSKP